MKPQEEQEHPKQEEFKRNQNWADIEDEEEDQEIGVLDENGKRKNEKRNWKKGTIQQEEKKVFNPPPPRVKT